GARAAGVYFGPLLAAALTALTASIAAAVLALAVTAWAVQQVVAAAGSPEADKAAENVRKLRRR
ncbi:DUF6251 family protein, partial [Streptomyces sp. NPDC059506]|uniref:DUF6251 family protein n=1 Tax=Streptomyces sp. NPDC059506 TaxID=3347751 RepID=UPI0036C9AB32